MVERTWRVWTPLWDRAGRDPAVGLGGMSEAVGARLKVCNPVGVRGVNTENSRLKIPVLPATPCQASVGCRLDGSSVPAAQAPPGGQGGPSIRWSPSFSSPRGHPPVLPAPPLVSLFLSLFFFFLVSPLNLPPKNRPVGERKCPVPNCGVGYKKCIG